MSGIEGTPMTTDIEWLTDAHGNRCSVEYFGSRKAAQAALDSLKNCENCTNCSDCSYCSGCSGCSGCSDCSRCSRCCEDDPPDDGPDPDERMGAL